MRPAAADDAGFLADVVIEATRAQGLLPDGFDERRWRERFSAWTLEQVRGQVPGSTTSVIETGSVRAGRLRVTRTADHIELSGLQLLPRVQRQGIGTAIIEDLKAQAARAGVPLDLDVEKGNRDARKLYERLGFTQIGETERESHLRWDPRAGADETSARRSTG
jgi:ribosomal protein S18 acetylase RimI-like enzyme